MEYRVSLASLYGQAKQVADHAELTNAVRGWNPPAKSAMVDYEQVLRSCDKDLGFFGALDPLVLWYQLRRACLVAQNHTATAAFESLRDPLQAAKEARAKLSSAAASGASSPAASPEQRQQEDEFALLDKIVEFADALLQSWRSQEEEAAAEGSAAGRE